MRQSEKNSGIITNLPTLDVLWSAGRNVRFKPGFVYKMPGRELLATVPSNAPIRAMFTFLGHDRVLRTMVCCDTKVYSYTLDFTAYQDITPTSLVSSGSTDAWQFAMIGGMPVVTDGVNGIWQWSDYSSVLASLEGSPYGAKCLTSVMGRLMLGDVQPGGSTVVSRIVWSKPFDPTKTALGRYGSGGQLDISSPDTGVDAREWIKAICVRGIEVFVFCDRKIWMLDSVPHPYYFKPRVFSEDTGILSRRGYCKANGSIYLIGSDDVYRIDDTVVPIGFPIRNSLFPNINKAAADKSFVFYQPDTKDVFFCVPIESSSSPNTAFVYNIEAQNWTICDAAYTCHTHSWANSTTDMGDMAGSWDSLADKQWDDMSELGVIPYNVVGDDSGRIYKMDIGDHDNNQAIVSRIETGDMVMEGERFFKLITRIYPSLKLQDQASALLISVGSRKSLHHSIKWSSPVEYIHGVDEFVPIRALGKYIRIAFHSQQTDSRWILDGYDFKHILRGGD